MTLTHRDLDLLEALTQKVRLLTPAQIARAWWSDTTTGRTNAARRLDGLARAALLGRTEALAHPLLDLSAPVFSWSPGEPAPHFGALSRRLQARWPCHPRRITVYFASRTGVALFGGATPGRVKNRCQVTHDLHVGSVYLVYHRDWPEHAACWVGEDAFAPERQHQKLPDAVLAGPDGAPFRAVEFGGRYSAARVEAFHADCAARGLPYQLW